MYINPKLKLNKFRKCSIPSNRDYFSRYGFADVPANQFTGDEPAPMPMTKVEAIEDLKRYAEMKQKDIDNGKND